MSEPSLRELQRLMKARIRPTEAAQPSSTVTLPVNPQRGTPGIERLSVYAGGYRARLREALGEVFQAVRQVLGERAFTDLAEAYAARHPSHDYNLSFIGRHLPEFLAASALTERLPFLPDLARLEWRVCLAFHAFEQPPLDPSALPAWSVDEWTRARCIFQPSLGLIASAWPILDIWEARSKPRESVTIDLVNRPQRVLVARDGVTVRCGAIDARQYTLLEDLLDGRRLGDACETLAAEAGQGPLPLTEWFADWARRGLMVRCDLR